MNQACQISLNVPQDVITYAKLSHRLVLSKLTFRICLLDSCQLPDSIASFVLVHQILVVIDSIFDESTEISGNSILGIIDTRVDMDQKK